MQISAGSYGQPRRRWAPRTSGPAKPAHCSASPLLPSAPGVSGVTPGWAEALERVGLPAADAGRYAPVPEADLSHLTPDDRELVAAVTGTVVSSAGQVHEGDDDDPLAGALADDRIYRRVSGSLTPTYLRVLGHRYAEPGPTHLSAELIAAAADYCTARARRRATDPTPRSSFSIAV